MAADGSAPDVRVENLVRRGNRPRARSISAKRMSKRELERGRMEAPEYVTDSYNRPKTRGECLNGEHGQRPCPFVGCVRHLFLDVNEDSGSIKINHPPADDSDEALVATLYAMGDTCSLDVADRGGATLEECGSLVNVVRERCRQLEEKSLARLRELDGEGALADLLVDQ